MTFSKMDLAVVKARALREARDELRSDPDLLDGAALEAALWLEHRAQSIAAGNDPAIPDEPTTAGSRLRVRAGHDYIRWTEIGHSGNDTPWVRVGLGNPKPSAYDDLDVVQVWLAVQP